MSDCKVKRLVPFKKTGSTIAPISSTDKLVLPQQNTPAAPTLAFGDGDSGLLETSDDVLSISIAGIQYYTMSSSGLYAVNNSYSFKLVDIVASYTIPAYRFVNDDDTGMGRGTGDSLSLIAGGVEGIRITEVGGYTKTQLQLITTANAPTYTEGAIYYDSTLHKLRIGGAAGWETVTSV
jgi:hypothetical protein